MKIRIITDTEQVAQSLKETIDLSQQAAATEPTYIAGATESLWQLAVDFGAMSLPLGVLGNLIASWIWEAKKQAEESPITTLKLSSPSKVKVVFFSAGKPIEVQIESDDLPAIRATVEAAIHDANH